VDHPLALRDVAIDFEDRQHFALFASVGDLPALDDDALAVFANVRELALPSGLSAEHRVDIRAIALQIALKDGARVLADRFLGLPAVGIGRATVPGDDDAFAVANDDGVGRKSDQRR